MDAARKPTIKQTQRYTYADYCTWGDDERWELVDGVAYAMAPAPTEFHQSISANTLVQIGQFLRGKKCKVYHAPFDVRLNADTKDNTVVQPDLSVICDRSKLNEKGCVGAPDMIVEILSPSSATHDRLLKFEKYRQAGVREYWIIDPAEKVVSVHILKDGEYTTNMYGEDSLISVHVLEGCKINMKEVFEQ